MDSKINKLIERCNARLERTSCGDQRFKVRSIRNALSGLLGNKLSTKEQQNVGSLANVLYDLKVITPTELMEVCMVNSNTWHGAMIEPSLPTQIEASKLSDMQGRHYS